MSLSEFLASQSVLLLIAAALVVAFIVNEWMLARRTGPTLSPNAVVKLINESKARVIDLRPAADFKRGHILNSENAPTARQPEVQQQLLKHPDKPVVAVCAMGMTSKGFARKLRAEGHTAVFPLAGGLNAWETAGLPLTTRTPPTKTRKRSS